MRTPLLTLALLASAAGVHAQTSLKLGGWDATYKTQVDGASLPASVEKMPPAQRAKMEAVLREAWKPRTRVHKTCLTKADLQEMAKGPDSDDECKYNKLRKSANGWEADMKCSDGRTGHAVFEATSAERYSGHIVQQLPAGKGRGTLNVDISARWASASCKGYDD